MSKLMIVESPTKAKKVEKILKAIDPSGEWIVRASVGHVRDLPARPKQGIGVDMDNNYAPEYEITKPDVVKSLINLSRKASHVVLATDLDREGEGIAWHLCMALGLPLDTERVTFDAITEETIKAALSSPRVIDMGLVAAQEARRVLDRLIGYQVSPALGGKRSAGRVQSPALMIIVEREREIRNFKPKSHFTVTASLELDRGSARWDFSALLPKDAEQKIWQDKVVAERIAQTTQLTVISSDASNKSKAPPPPYTTSTLQQVASAKLNMSLTDTMAAAQKLFEDGAITYHRTDSPVLSGEAENMVRSFLGDNGMGVPAEPNKWKAGKGAQEAHEGIRVTKIERTEAGATANEKKLYDLIRSRTLACQMNPYTFSEVITVFSGAEDSRFVSRKTKTIDKGWTEIEGSTTENDEVLPDFIAGDVHNCSCKMENKDTQPPPRYTEGSLVKKLDACQVGRPSTYASILSVLKHRQYVQITKGKMSPTKEGEAVFDALIKGGFRFMSLTYTKEVEAGLDMIAHKDASYLDVVSEVQAGLEEDIKKIPDEMKAGLRAPIEPIKGHGEPCPECGKPLATRVIGKGKNKGNKFLSCTGWTKDGKGCDYVDWCN